ncbi:hypothetical protein CBS101457_005205 [Exobasidium rhododendri]|nr:hypothetical protein CBS101457_005205 [Exobasidium rhododendri]
MATSARKRRNRILCLHGPSQSAASFRAALNPLCDRMGRHYEFHFLEAPFVVSDVGCDERQVDAWTQAAVLASKIIALQSDLSYESESEVKDGSATELQSEIHSISTQLVESSEGREVFERFYQEDIEGLVARKTGRSLSRDWVTTIGKNGVGVTGLQFALAQIGDYIREHGTVSGTTAATRGSALAKASTAQFHGVIGYETGGSLALLVQSLLTHPLSSTKLFPSFFPRLPKGVKRMPRMGGWEEEPPAPNDPRLGRENLTKDFVPAQKPFETIITFFPGLSTTTSIGVLAESWLKSHPPLLSFPTKDTFSTHSISIIANKEAASPITLERTLMCKPGENVIETHRSHLLAEWMALAIESCQGNEAASEQLTSLDVVPAKL